MLAARQLYFTTYVSHSSTTLFPERISRLFPPPHEAIPQRPAIPSLCTNICLHMIFHPFHVRYMFIYLILLELNILVIPDEVALYAVFFKVPVISPSAPCTHMSSLRNQR